MPYSSGQDDALPDRVKSLPDKKRRQFVHVFNSAYERCMAGQTQVDADAKSCESFAFANAYSVIKEEDETTNEDAGKMSEKLEDPEDTDTVEVKEEIEQTEVATEEPESDSIYEEDKSGNLGEAVWTTAYVNDLNDSAFLYIEPGGEKDGEGKTVPRSLRHFPYKDDSGKVDLPHLRNAIARIPVSNIPDALKATLQAKARKMLGGSAKESQEEPLRMKIAEQASLRLGEAARGVQWEVVCIAPGLSKNRTLYEDAVLKKAVPLFEGVSCFADHNAERPYPRSVRDVVGWFENARFEANTGIVADFKALASQSWFTETLREAYERGKPDLIGFSINGDGSRRIGRENGEPVYVVETINSIDSVDAVIAPSAGGRLAKLVASVDMEEKVEENLDKETESKVEETKESKEAEEARKEMTSLVGEARAAKEEATRIQEELKVARAQARLEQEISKSDLPDAAKSQVRKQFEGKDFEPEKLQEAITDQKSLVDELFGSAVNKPQGYTASVEVGDSQKDRAAKALKGLIWGEDIDGVPKARSLKEAYCAFVGKAPWTVTPDEILLESACSYSSESARLREAGDPVNIPTTTWAELLSDYISKKMVKDYRDLPYDDWRKVCSDVSPIPNFQTHRRIRLGGYGELSAVTQGGAYSTATPPGDEEATYSISKRGRLESLTLETIANDDVGAVRKIPQRLARAAKITLYRFVFNFFTSSAAIYDGSALFQTATTAHSSAGANDGGTAAALNDANLTSARVSMMDKAAYGEATHLGFIEPRLLVVPIELTAVGQRLIGNEYTYVGTPGSASPQDINVHRGKFEVIEVPYWSNAVTWYVVADPVSIPTIEVGFFGGNEEPEMFVQDLPNVGSMFDRDAITYKLRHIYGGAVTDWRGFYRASNGAGPY